MKILMLFIFLTASLLSDKYNDIVKEKKIYPMGERIHKTRCQSLSAKQFDSYESLVEAISKHNACGKLNMKHTQALALYLWDHRDGSKQQEYEKLVVDQDEKCPVCGMYLYKYPQWISKMSIHGKVYYFDGNKDMLKFYFRHGAQKDAVLRVQEYYTHKVIDGKTSYFVVGSDVYGPMGDELIAFRSKVAAKRFLLDHRAQKIIGFQALTLKMVEQLDQ